MWKTVSVIINPISGTDQPILSEISRVLDPVKVAWDCSHLYPKLHSY